MKIGIIVYSQTGNTYSVALRLQEKFTAAGHSASIERIELAGNGKPQGMSFQIKNRPDVKGYDYLVFGSPVQGFRLSPVMKDYLSNASDMNKKKVGILITQQLTPWMGGNRAAETVKKLCEAKGAEVRGIGIVRWSNNREQLIADAVEKLSGLFQMQKTG